MFKNNINCSSCCAALVSRSFSRLTGHTFFDNDNKQKQSVQSIFISNMLTAVVSDIPVNAKIVRFVHRICFRFEKQSLVLKFENLKYNETEYI